MVTQETIRVLFAGGGTGGHLYPALRLADGLRVYAGEHGLPEPHIAFAGNPHGLEGELLPGRERFYPLPVQGFHRGGIRTLFKRNLGFPGRLISSYRLSKRMLHAERPDVVVGTGGYVSGPPLLAAALRGIPTLIQEQNSYPGITTRLLAWFTDRVHLAYREAEKRLPKKKKRSVSVGIRS